MLWRKLKAVLIGLAMVTTVAFVVTASNPSFDLSETPLSKLSPKVVGAMHATDSVPVLIETTNQDYEPLTRFIEANGGTVSFQYQYTSSMAARIPSSSLTDVAALDSVKAVYLDETRGIDAASNDVGIPRPSGAPGLTEIRPGPAGVELDVPYAAPMTEAEIREFAPQVYNLDLTNALGTADARPRGNFGAGTTVAIIDTGIFSGHFMLAGSVVGGVDLSADVGGPFEGFDRQTNHWHGSHVAGIVLGHGLVCSFPASLFVLSIEQHTGVTLSPCPVPGFEFLKAIPLFGMAPLAEAYVIKVFPHTGAGAPTSTIIAGIENAIANKDVFGIDVISMSLGGATLFDGRDLEDRTVDKAVSAGIAVISAAGNDGPASMTVASPGSANKGMAVAAAAMPVNVRVLWDLSHGSLYAGNELFVSDRPQIIDFSSRGPTADGRGKPDVAAPGTFILSAFPLPFPGAGNLIAFVSGTSMATPHVSGATLLLEGFADLEGVDATPKDMKDALVKSGERLHRFGTRDFGSGLIDVDKAMDHLKPSKARFRIDLSGAEEVPQVDTDASGDAKVQLKGERLEFRVRVCDIEDVTQAHIHVGAFGTNGPVAVFLFESFADPFSTDRCKTLSKGRLSASDLFLPGLTWDAFVEEIRNGNTYVNVHTLDNPGGEIRGQLSHETELLAESVPLADISTINRRVGDDFTISKRANLKPGESLEVIVPTDLLTSSITLEIEDVRLGRDAPHGDTWLSNFGWDVLGQPQVNSLEVWMHGAKRGGSFFDYEIASANVWGDATLIVADDGTSFAGDMRLDVPLKPFGDFNARMIEPGFHKVVIQNDWTSFDKIRFRYTVEVESAPLPVPDVVLPDSVAQGEFDLFPLFIPPGTSEITLVLTWPNDWSQYPTNDLDFFVVDTAGGGLFDLGLLCLRFSGPAPPLLIFQGATLNSPEVCVIEEPPAGSFVFLVVQGFAVHLGMTEPYELQVFFS